MAKRKKSPLGKNNRRVIMMGDDGVVLYAVEKKKAVRVISLPWEAPKFNEKMVSALKSGYSGPVILLYDAVEQHYRKDRIPPVGIADKRKILNRKLNLAFPNLTIKAALELKKPGAKKGLQVKKSTEKPEYLFAGLPKSEMLNRVVAVLYEAEVAIQGLGLLPVESVGLVEDLADRCLAEKGAARSKWSIILAQNETGGLHQIVVKDGNLAMRRITPVADNLSPSVFSGEVIREFKATLSYIARFGYNDSEGLDVICVLPKDCHAALNTNNMPCTNLCLLDLPDALELLGGQYAGEATRTYADALYVLWAASKSKLTMPMKMAELDRVSMPRKVAQFSSIALALGVLGLLYMNYDSYTVYNDRLNLIDYKTTQQNALNREYEQETGLFDELPVPPPTVMGVLEIKKMLQDNSMDLTPVLSELNQLFSNAFLLQNIKIEHKPYEKASIADPDGLMKNPAVAVVQSVLPGQKPPSERGDMTINFTVSLTQGGLPLEEKVVRGEGLLESLKLSFPEHDVELVRQFGGVSRTGAFSIEDQDDEARTEGSNELTAEFKIEGPPL